MLPPETLADLLALGPLPLAAALRYAGEIAAELRDLHQQARTYGKLTAASVLLTESGAHLAPSHRFWEEPILERDVHAFGAVLYQMLTGTAAPATLTATEVREPGANTGPAHLRPAAVKLALKCMAATGTPLSMQQAATELRLLGLLLRQYEASTAAAPIPPWDAPEPAPKAQTGDTSATPVVPLGPDSFGHPKARAQAVLQPAGGNCPKCHSTAVYVSRTRSWLERMLARWDIPICRCHRCYHRYVVIARLKIGKDMPVGSERAYKPRRRRR